MLAAAASHSLTTEIYPDRSKKIESYQYRPEEATHGAP
jgi:hypothetical protein